jgi:hypothetical protein
MANPPNSRQSLKATASAEVPQKQTSPKARSLYGTAYLNLRFLAASDFFLRLTLGFS